ncbi:MAG: hypothetical protein IJV33_05965 [Bacteroidaceae bacterium]|nr:hypothetical protein [Bacteroidaceae bacterium]
MTVRQDCPECGRKSNEGHLYTESEDKYAPEVLAVAGAGIGALLGGPIGAPIVGGLGYKLAKYIQKRHVTDDDGYVWYRFNCMNPNCKHTWISKVKE